MKKSRENTKFGIAGIDKKHRAEITVGSQLCEVLRMKELLSVSLNERYCALYEKLSKVVHTGDLIN
jgi:hypothetical protein